MVRWLAQISGGALVLLVLADVFLTVLYARSGTGLLSRRAGVGTWRAFRALAARVPRHRDTILTYAGPMMLVVLATVWVGGLVVGFALVVWPVLGLSIQAMQGGTPTDFVTALYYTGGCATTAGGGDLRPVTAFGRLVSLADSVVGISMITLMLTYFMQIYTALHRRNTFVLRLHQATDNTGDAAELVAGLGPCGDFTDGRRVLAALAGELADVYEAHHFYGALLFFRFREPFYAMPRAAVVVMDAVTLVRTALDGERYADLTRSGAVTQMWRGGTHLLDQLSRVFVPPLGEPNRGPPPDAETAARWRRRYAAAVVRLRAAGIATAADEGAGADAYVATRREWDGYVTAFAAYLDHPADAVDPAATRAA